MLYKDKKFLFLILFVLLLFPSCNRNKEHDSKEMLEKRRICLNVSKIIIGQKNYWKIYSDLNDSIDNWIKNRLSSYVAFKDLGEYNIDSIICINIDCNRFVGAIVSRNLKGEYKVQDYIDYIYGAKIKENWYFFSGATIVLPREMYQKDTHTPLSFAKLHEIAMELVFSGYLIKDKQGKWEVNDKWFKIYFEGSGWGDFNNQSSNDRFLQGRRFKTEKEYYEACYLQKVKNIWHR